MHNFYVAEARLGTVQLTEMESGHAVRVLRLGAGDEVEVMDGRGGLFRGKVEEPHPKRCLLQLSETVPDPNPRIRKVHLALSPTKNMDRMEWMVEKAVEVGVDAITFLLCQHSERKEIKLERLEKVAISAMKQSHQRYLPQLSGMVAFGKFLKTLQPAEAAMAHLLNESSQPDLTSLSASAKLTTILIGPEGDFSPQEIALAQEAGLPMVKLGKSRLRTETAALTSCVILNLINY
jgi:16S rRNA (uracil1498-N3)-methyltransferase